MRRSPNWREKIRKRRLLMSSSRSKSSRMDPSMKRPRSSPSNLNSSMTSSSNSLRESNKDCTQDQT